jgi:AbiEi antitoxin C-terminal domain
MRDVPHDRFGLVTLDDVRAAGHSRSWWHRAHRAGLLVAVHPGVSRLARARPSPQQALRAAAVAAGGVASHLSAAWLWGAPVTPVDPIDVTVSDRRRSSRVAGVRVHRPTDRLDLVAVERRGVPVTSPLRTLLDVGAVASREVVAIVLATFVADDLVTDDALRDGLDRHARRGRSGVGALRVALDAYDRVPLARGA